MDTLGNDVPLDVVDTQIHVWENNPTRPWDVAAPSVGGEPFPVETALAEMDRLGIRSAILSLPPGYRSRLANGAWRYDNSYAEEASLNYPERFASVIRVDPNDPEAAKLTADCRSRPGVVGLRLTLGHAGAWDQFVGGGYTEILEAAASSAVPVMIAAAGKADELKRIWRTLPDGLSIILDHVGLPQPPAAQLTGNPFAKLDAILSLASETNLYVKFSGLPSLSNEPYPFQDLWPYINRVLDAFGGSRLMWASDVTRVRGLHSWSEALDYLRYTNELDAEEKRNLLGGTARKVLRWPMDKEQGAS